MAPRGNQMLGNAHFRKHWHKRIKTWFDQPARKLRRRQNRQAKAVEIAPRPVAGLLRLDRISLFIKYSFISDLSSVAHRRDTTPRLVLDVVSLFKSSRPPESPRLRPAPSESPLMWEEPTRPPRDLRYVINYFAWKLNVYNILGQRRSSQGVQSQAYPLPEEG